MKVTRRLFISSSVVAVIAIAGLSSPLPGDVREIPDDPPGGTGHARDQLKRLALKILDDRHPPYSLHSEIADLAKLLDANATVRSDAPGDISEGETRTEDGLALSPVMAAMCVRDFARTVVFARGLHAAIQDSRNRSSGRPTRVLYAGSGPYAVLAVPSMAVFSTRQVRFTILDIHHPSVESARSVVTNLGLAGYVSSYEVIDAKRYQVRPDEAPDVIVMEIMNAALEKEPQVAITRHLLDQAPRAVLVPESVRVDAYLVDVSKEFALMDSKPTARTSAQDRVLLGTVFELNREFVEAWKSENGAQLPAASIQLPDPLERRYSPMLFTEIQAYKDHRLGAYDSGLTIPRALPFDGPIRGGQILEFRYRLGAHPGLVASERP